jgi:hypothetical protein
MQPYSERRTLLEELAEEDERVRPVATGQHQDLQDTRFHSCPG